MNDGIPALPTCCLTERMASLQPPKKRPMVSEILTSKALKLLELDIKRDLDTLEIKKDSGTLEPFQTTLINSDMRLLVTSNCERSSNSSSDSSSKESA